MAPETANDSSLVPISSTSTQPISPKNDSSSSTLIGGPLKTPIHKSEAVSQESTAWESYAWGASATWGFDRMGSASDGRPAADIGIESAGRSMTDQPLASGVEAWQSTRTTTVKEQSKLRKSNGLSALSTLVTDAKFAATVNKSDKLDGSSVWDWTAIAKDKKNGEKANHIETLPTFAKPATKTAEPFKDQPEDIWGNYGKTENVTANTKPNNDITKDSWGAPSSSEWNDLSINNRQHGGTTSSAAAPSSGNNQDSAWYSGFWPTTTTDTSITSNLQTLAAKDGESAKSKDGMDAKTFQTKSSPLTSTVPHNSSPDERSNTTAVPRSWSNTASNDKSRGKKNIAYVPPAVPDPPSMGTLLPVFGGGLDLDDGIGDRDDNLIGDDWASPASLKKTKSKTTTTMASGPKVVQTAKENKDVRSAKFGPDNKIKEVNPTKGAIPSTPMVTPTKTIQDLSKENKQKEQPKIAHAPSGAATVGKLKKEAPSTKKEDLKNATESLKKKDDMQNKGNIKTTPSEAINATTDAWSFWGAKLKAETSAVPVVALASGKPFTAMTQNVNATSAATSQKTNKSSTKPPEAKLKDVGTSGRVGKVEETVDMPRPVATKAEGAQVGASDKMHGNPAVKAQIPVVVNVPGSHPPIEQLAGKATSAPRGKSSKKVTSGKGIPGSFPSEASTTPLRNPSSGEKIERPGATKSKTTTKVVPPRAKELDPGPPPKPIMPKRTSKPLGTAVGKSTKREHSLPVGSKLDVSIEKNEEKKERPRVVRNNFGVSLWGFWNTAPKLSPTSGLKESPHDLASVSKPKQTTAPTLARSMSARKATQDDSVATRRRRDSEDLKRSETRPTKPSRGMSFSSIFGRAPAPKRSNSTRQPVSAAHRASNVNRTQAAPVSQQSASIAIPDKAAKVMGIATSKRRPTHAGSIHGKPTTGGTHDYVALQDDDFMVTAAASVHRPVDDTFRKDKSEAPRPTVIADSQELPEARSKHKERRHREINARSAVAESSLRKNYDDAEYYDEERRRRREERRLRKAMGSARPSGAIPPTGEDNVPYSKGRDAADDDGYERTTEPAHPRDEADESAPRKKPDRRKSSYRRERDTQREHEGRQERRHRDERDRSHDYDRDRDREKRRQRHDGGVNTTSDDMKRLNMMSGANDDSGDANARHDSGRRHEHGTEPRPTVMGRGSWLRKLAGI